MTLLFISLAVKKNLLLSHLVLLRLRSSSSIIAHNEEALEGVPICIGALGCAGASDIKGDLVVAETFGSRFEFFETGVEILEEIIEEETS